MCDISVLDPALGSDLFLCVAVDSAIYFGPGFPCPAETVRPFGADDDPCREEIR